MKTDPDHSVMIATPDSTQQLCTIFRPATGCIAHRNLTATKLISILHAHTHKTVMKLQRSSPSAKLGQSDSRPDERGGQAYHTPQLWEEG
jgi:hypothetical protein